MLVYICSMMYHVGCFSKMIFEIIFVHFDRYGLVNIRVLYINAELWLILRTFKMLLMILSMILKSCKKSYEPKI